MDKYTRREEEKEERGLYTLLWRVRASLFFAIQNFLELVIAGHVSLFY